MTVRVTGTEISNSENTGREISESDRDRYK